MSSTVLASTIGADVDLSNGDMAFNAYGDVAMIAGAAMVQQRLYRRFVTTPGDLLFHSDYGAGLAGLIQSPLSDAELAGLGTTLAAQAVLDPAVQSVQGVLVQQSAPGSVVITISITVAGGNTSTTIPIVITGH